MKTFSTLRRMGGLALALGLAGTATAQQQPQLSQFMLNPYLFNPAAAGINDYTDVKAGYRSQWVGVPDAPQTAYATAHMALNQKDLNREELGSLPSRGASTIRFKTEDVPRKPRHGVGLAVINDRAGLFNRTGVFATYAYHHPIGKKYYLAGGLSVGASFWRLGQGDITNVRQASDNALFGGRNATNVPEISLGGMLYSDKLFLGISSGQLTQNKLQFDKANGVTLNGKLYNHMYLTAGYRFAIDDEFDIIPLVLAKYARPSLALDAGAKVRYRRNFWAGAMVRYADATNGGASDAVVGMVGLNLAKLVDVGYSYDFTLSNLSGPSSGSHEIVVGLRLNNRKNASPKLW